MQTPLEIIKEAYTKAGIAYATQKNEGYTYIIRCHEDNVKELESADFDVFLHSGNEFIEFCPDGQLASY